MATIRKHRDKWQVQVRRQGQPAMSRSFQVKADAERWARQTEMSVERAELQGDLNLLRRTTLGDLLGRYRDTVSPKKRSAATERYRIDMFCRDPLSKLSLSGLTREALATFRDDRLKLVSSETVRQYLVILRQVLETARKEWGVPIIGNPLDNIKRPAGAKARTRRLQPTEFDRLRQALSQVRNSLVGDVIRFALETGMRRGELLQGQWVDVDWDARTLTIHMTKNGDPRTIPLSPAALTVLHALWAQRPNDAAIFPISANAVKLAWRRLCASAGIKNLRFHDLRHEAVSRFFELGLSVPEVQLISGHKDVRMLFRYTHLRASDVARKMATGPLMELSTQRDRI